MPGGRGDDAVFDRAVLADQHRQRLLRLQAHEFDVLEPGVLLGGEDDARAARQAGEQRRRLRQRALEAAFLGGGAHLAVDARALLARRGRRIPSSAST